MAALTTDIEITLSQHGWIEVEAAANAASEFRLEHHDLPHGPSEDIAAIARRASTEAQKSGGLITRKLNVEFLKDCLSGHRVSAEVDAIQARCISHVALLDEELRVEVEGSQVRW